MLRAARVSSGLTGAELASRAAMSQSRISKIETGKYGLPTKEDLALLISALGLVGERRSEICRQYELAQLDPGSYLHIAAAGLGKKQAQILELERAASLVRVYQSSVIPGLLQIPAYSELLMRALGHDDETIAIALDQRALRQSTLRNRRTNFSFVIDEPILRGPDILGVDDALMEEQLDLLKALAKWPNIRISTLRANSRRPIAVGNSFMIIDRKYVTAETTVRELVSTSDLEIRSYEQAYFELEAAAKPGLPPWATL